MRGQRAAGFRRRWLQSRGLAVTRGVRTRGPIGMVVEDTMHSLQGSSLQYNLFGGAISVDMPRGLVDASDVRPVPDNQEVWLDESGQSVIVEVLERVKGLQDDQAVSFFFNDLVCPLLHRQMRLAKPVSVKWSSRRSDARRSTIA